MTEIRDLFCFCFVNFSFTFDQSMQIHPILLKSQSSLKCKLDSKNTGLVIFHV